MAVKTALNYCRLDSLRPHSLVRLVLKDTLKGKQNLRLTKNRRVINPKPLAEKSIIR
jgi:hypothetical protein